MDDDLVRLARHGEERLRIRELDEDALTIDQIDGCRHDGLYREQVVRQRTIDPLTDDGDFVAHADVHQLGELTAELVMFPQVLVNVQVPRGFDWKANKAISLAQAEAEKSLNGRGRVLLRPSGTEPLLRVMVEGEPRQVVEQAANSIADAVRRAAAA